MKIWIVIIVSVISLSGCSVQNTNPIQGNAEIDWVDFVKLHGKSYTGLFYGVIKDPSDITNQVVGEVEI